MKDNYFEELKEAEILREKLSTLRDIEEHIGKYFSREWVVKNVLYINDDENKQMQKQIKKELIQYGPPEGQEVPADQSQEQPPEEEPVNAADESLTVINRKRFKPQRRISK